MGAAALINFTEVAKHNTAGDCWVVLGGKVFDLTAFSPSHPGGSALVTDLAGTDGTAVFKDAHDPGKRRSARRLRSHSRLRSPLL